MFESGDQISSVWERSVSSPAGLSQSLLSSLGGARWAGLWLMLLLGPVLVILAVANHSLAWQGEQVLSTGRGNGEMGSGDPMLLRRWVVFHIS